MAAIYAKQSVAKRLQKREVTFSDYFIHVVDILFLEMQSHIICDLKDLF